MFWEYLVSSVVNITVLLYCTIKLSNKSINYRSVYIYIGYLLLIISGVFLLYSDMELIRPINFFSLLLIFTYCFITKNFKEAIMVCLTSQIIAVLAEIIVAFVLYFIEYISKENFQIELLGNFSLNLIISLLMYILLHLKVPYKLHKKLKNITSKIKNKVLIFVTFFILISIYIVLFTIYMEYNTLYLLIFNVWLALIYAILMYIFIKEKDSNKYYQEENEHLMKILNRFETLFSYEKANNHENKNQFLIIEEMIKNKDEGLLDYVKAIIKENKKENKSIFSKVKKIPSGGLQGIIYRKILTMKESKIKYKVDISKEINQDSLNSLTNVENYNLCRIIGVFLDNAIDESIKSKEKEIFISMYKENDIIIEISNYCKDLPDMNKIGKKKYTTKSSTHGYGLMLVSKIISESKCCQNEHRISENIFTQIIKIKM